MLVPASITAVRGIDEQEGEDPQAGDKSFGAELTLYGILCWSVTRQVRGNVPQTDAHILQGTVFARGGAELGEWLRTCGIELDCSISGDWQSILQLLECSLS